MPGSLSLVGLGISDEKGIPLAGLEELKACSKIFAESYTNLLSEGTFERLEALAGKKIELLGREQVESERQILDAASSSQVALVVSGDPMIATTHVSLIMAARKKGIETKIIHASSIISAAIGESGLQAYKFGKMVTIAYWRENYRPMAAYEVIAGNLSRGLHTLLLLDIDEKLGPMAPAKAAEILIEMEKEGKKEILFPETKVVLLSSVGRDGARTAFSSLGGVAAGKPVFHGIPSVLIVPGKLHFLEEEFLRLL